MSLTEAPEAARAEGRPIHAWLETASGEKIAIRGVCSLGRSASNNLVLRGEKVSRNHALIQVQGETEIWLTDLGSVNGTYLNGQRVTRATRIYDGDLIGLGPHRLAFHQTGGLSRSRPNFSTAELTIGDVETENCWLLFLQADALSGAADVLSHMRSSGVATSWLDRCRDIVEERGGKINRYTKEGFLVYWRDRPESRAAVAQTLGALGACQFSICPTFRLVLHYVQINIGHPPGGHEILSGSAINFVFRIERLARTLNASSLITEVAQALLHSFVRFEQAGRHSLSGVEGEHTFYRVQLPVP